MRIAENEQNDYYMQLWILMKWTNDQYKRMNIPLAKTGSL